MPSSAAVRSHSLSQIRPNESHCYPCESYMPFPAKLCKGDRYPQDDQWVKTGRERKRERCHKHADSSVDSVECRVSGEL